MKRILSITIIALFAFPQLNAQVNVSGFFQTFGQQSARTLTIKTPRGNMVDESELISLSLQQANVLFTSNHNNGFSTYLNVEMLNSLSTMQGFGHISIEDAFVKYNHNQTLNIKLGYFTPTFNSFNEIYNKFPLMPYAYRPFMYEKALANIINPEDILPAKALAQIYGYFPINKVKLDYSLFLGNPENSYLRKNGTDVAAVGGTSTVDFVTVGGRVGLRYDEIKLGMSMTSDKDNLNAFNIASGYAPENIKSLGDKTRMRIGADVSAEYFGLNLSGELFMVNYSLDDAEKDSMVVWYNDGKNGIGDKLDKFGYFVTLQYDFEDLEIPFLENVFIYGMYMYYEDGFNSVYSKGLESSSSGFGYRFSPLVVFKGQYVKTKVSSPSVDYDADLFRFAISVAL